MTEDTTLIQKREELKRPIAAGAYRTLVDIITDGTCHLIRTCTRNQKSLPFWYGAVIIALVSLIIAFWTSILLGEFFPLRQRAIPVDITLVVLMLVAMIFSNTYKGVFITTWHDHLLDDIRSASALNNFQTWLVNMNNQRRPLLFGLVFGIFVGFYEVVLSTLFLEGFPGWGSIILGIILGFQAGILIYYFGPVLNLVTRLNRYEFQLYAADPSSSEVIDHLSDLLNNFVYIAAGITATATLVLTLLGVLTLPTFIVLVLMSWLPLIVVFLLSHFTLAKIITGAKWKTLNEIQAEVERLRTGGKLAEKETIEAVNRLMDYHDRIKATPNSALNLRTSLSFLNSLLLPVIAFVLANLDKIVELFS